MVLDAHSVPSLFGNDEIFGFGDRCCYIMHWLGALFSLSLAQFDANFIFCCDTSRSYEQNFISFFFFA